VRIGREGLRGEISCCDRDNVKNTQGRYSGMGRDPRMLCLKEDLGSRADWCSGEGQESRPVSMNFTTD